MKKNCVFVFLMLFFFTSFARCTISCNARYLHKVYHPATPNAQGYGSQIGTYTIFGTGTDAYYETVWSDRYTLNVEFYSGYELNEAAGETLFNEHSIIAIIKWRNGGYSVVAIKKWITNLKYVTEEEITLNNSTGEKIEQINGYDKEERYWEFNF
jgi:hypothetical protein